MENQIEQIVNTLSEKLDKPMEYSWQVAIQGKRIEGIIDLVLIFVFIAMNYLIYQKLSKELNKEKNQYVDKTATKIGVMVVSFVISLILMVILSEIAAEIIIPEYCVIRDIIQ